MGQSSPEPPPCTESYLQEWLIGTGSQEVSAENGELELRFWVYTAGRGIVFSEFEVSIGPDYHVEWNERTQ